MNYTLNQLRIFKKITETHSITRASEELHMTQPAVSIQLKKFQEQFEVPLTEMMSRRISITDFGWEVAEAAARILDEVNSINDRALKYSGLLSGKLKISTVSTGKYVMPFFLQEFLGDHKGVELLLDVTNKATVLESLRRNEVDFALVSVIPEDLEVLSLELMRNRLFLVGNSESKIEDKEHDRRIFNRIPLIYREQGSGTRFTMEEYFQQHRIPVKQQLELTSNEAVKQAVLAGLGYSVLPLIGIKNELQNGDLRIIPVKGFPIESTWNLIWLKGKKLLPAAQEYLEYLRKEKSGIIERQFRWYEDKIDLH